MSYKLQKPCSEIEKANFIVEYNHKKDLRIEETLCSVFALEKWEYLDGEKVIEDKESYKQQENQLIKEHIQNLTCTKRNFVLILNELGITYKQVKDLISQNENAQLEWDLCIQLERNNPLLDIMGQELNLTPYILDKIFLYANGEITNFEELK